VAISYFFHLADGTGPALIGDVHDLGLNLLAETGGVVFALFAIDRAVGAYEAARRQPARRAMVREAMHIFYPLGNTLNTLVGCYAREEDRFLLERALHGKNVGDLGEIVARIRLEDVPPIHGQKSWGELLPPTISMAQVQIDRFMVRYAAVDEPRLVAAVQDLEATEVMQGVARSGKLRFTAGVPPTQVWCSFVSRVRELQDAIAGVPGHLRVPIEFPHRHLVLNRLDKAAAGT